MSTEPVLLRRADGPLLHLVLNRPERRNALSAELRSAIADALSTASTADSVGAVLLGAMGDVFCAGFDLTELAAAPDPAAVFADAAAYHRAVHTFPKPIVAAVGGPALAGGFDLALLCDVRIASERATFGQPQVRRGIPASYGLVADVLGVATARDLCLSGRVIDAADALRLHVAAQVTSPEELVGVATAYAQELAANPGAAAAKREIVAAQPQLW